MTPLAWWLVALVDAAAKSAPWDSRICADTYEVWRWKVSDQRRQWLAAYPRGLA